MCISGEKAEMSMIVKLLEADTESSDALYLRECAYGAALIITKEKAYVWGMLNICQMPLFMSTKNNSARISVKKHDPAPGCKKSSAIPVIMP